MKGRTLLALTFACLMPAASAEGTPSVRALRGVVILSGGRLMPLDTYARAVTRAYSGSSSVEGFSALDWVARVLFDAPRPRSDRVFLIADPALADFLRLPRAGRRYSLDQLAPRMPELAERARAILGSRAVTEGFEKARRTGGAPPFIMPDKGHAAHLDRFIDCIEGKGENPCDVDAAVVVSRVTLKLLQSIRLGIPLSIGPEDYHLPAG